jgi:hypothetical protein
MKKYCPSLFAFPAQPIDWNDIYLFYSWNRTASSLASPDYICFNDRFCNSWSSTIRIPKINEPTTLLSCQMLGNTSFVFDSTATWDAVLRTVRWVFRGHCALTAIDLENECPKTTLFRCGKRCLSKHRLVDNVRDCLDNSDEIYNNSCALNDKYRIRCASRRLGRYIDVCISGSFVIGGIEKFGCNKQKENLPHFPTLCDGYVEDQELINGTIETDETNCEEWLCDNQYTRCNRIWNCLNGADEIHCYRQLCSNQDAHPCFLWNRSLPICLPIFRAGDGIIDCLGATDERHLCRDEIDTEGYQETAYRCWDNRTRDEQMTSQ